MISKIDACPKYLLWVPMWRKSTPANLLSLRWQPCQLTEAPENETLLSSWTAWIRLISWHQLKTHRTNNLHSNCFTIHIPRATKILPSSGEKFWNGIQAKEGYIPSSTTYSGPTTTRLLFSTFTFCSRISFGPSGTCTRKINRKRKRRVRRRNSHYTELLRFLRRK